MLRKKLRTKRRKKRKKRCVQFQKRSWICATYRYKKGNM